MTKWGFGGAYIDRAGEVAAAHHQVRQGVAKDDGEDPSANKTFDGLLGRKLDELSAAKGDAADVGENIVGDDQGGRQEEPDQAFQNVVHDEVGFDHNNKERHVRPSKLGELELELPAFEGAHKEDEAFENERQYEGPPTSWTLAAPRLTNNIEHEADEAVVSGQGQQHLVHKDNMLKVVDDALPVQEVHGGGKPVPVQALGGAELAGSGGDARDGDDLLEGDDLDDGDDEDDVYVAHEEGGEEATDHEQRPYCPRYEVLLLLLVVVLRWWPGVFLQLRRIVSVWTEGWTWRGAGRRDCAPSTSCPEGSGIPRRSDPCAATTSSLGSRLGWPRCAR